MTHALQAQQVASGAQFDAASSVPLTFGNDAAALAAVQSGVALCDRSHWGRLRVSDSDRLRFLHNQTTNQLQTLQPGTGCSTVFVTSTGRTVDLATAYATADSVLLFVSPGQAASLSEWMDRYIFFADKVKIADETDQSVAFTLLGPNSVTLLAQLGIEMNPDAPTGTHAAGVIQSIEVFVGVDSGVATPGFTVIAPAAAGAELWSALAAEATPMGKQAWEMLRIQQGRPMPGAELTADYNPLEAGLWHTISFDKGCYIGQETIARLNTYQGVKQQLWGLEMAAIAPPGTPIHLADEKVGVLTSCVATATGARGLGYIRTKAGGQGLTVHIEGKPAQVVDIPFASRGYLAP